MLEQWKYWTKINDWDSRNRLLEELLAKLRRREASAGEIQVLVVVCRPQWAKVARSLRRYDDRPLRIRSGPSLSRRGRACDAMSPATSTAPPKSARSSRTTSTSPALDAKGRRDLHAATDRLQGRAAQTEEQATPRRKRRA